MKIKLFFLALLVAQSHQKKLYYGYKVYQTKSIASEDTISQLIRFVEHDNYQAFDFWSKPRFQGTGGKIMVAPGHQNRLEQFFGKNNIDFEVLIQDVEKVEQIAEKEQRLQRMTKRSTQAIDWENYYDVDEIYQYLDEMSKLPHNVSVETYGKTHEERDLKLIRIEKAGPGAPNIIVEAGIHAREWIAPSVATFLIHSLLEEPENEAYLKNFNFHIIPVANPDGYTFSREKNRLWRKNRAKNAGALCRGVDPNRNFDFHWHEIGVSDNPCSEIYPGTEAFSEPETKSIKDYVLKLNPSPVFTMSLHSAADLFLLPYSYSHDARPENYDELFKSVKEACDNLNAVHGEDFRVIHTPNLYPVGGGSHDWYMGAMGAKYAFTVELRQGGLFGFDLPLSQIRPSGEEMWVAFKTMLDTLNK